MQEKLDASLPTIYRPEFDKFDRRWFIMTFWCLGKYNI
ncbi:hypothetical protein DSOL_4539 [Desulfosporosinus metallidurans]|uniref:Uncharacterized protein n=1 Tax=Desulfosporosinus metallidurans TaxID=1888891 RepID=A0A1Q8QJI2_9FIRM|nr:hypothetical protein DSOL_4539 [Desulfosporosinus metallidurans]